MWNVRGLISVQIFVHVPDPFLTIEKRFNKSWCRQRCWFIGCVCVAIWSWALRHSRYVFERSFIEQDQLDFKTRWVSKYFRLCLHGYETAISILLLLRNFRAHNFGPIQHPHILMSSLPLMKCVSWVFEMRLWAFLFGIIPPENTRTLFFYCTGGNVHS